jgi:hypothetical protein
MWFVTRWCHRSEVVAPAAMERSPFPDEGAETFLTIAQGRLEHQIATLDALDTKAAALLAGAVAEVAFLLALLALRPPDTHPLSGRSWVLLTAAASVALACVVVAWLAQSVRTWVDYPNTADAWNVACTKPAQYTWQMGLTLAAAFDANKPAQRGKTRQVRMANYLVLALTLLTLVAGLSVIAG